MTRNIATAAKAMFMTQPSVSMQLRALEKDLKVALYERLHGQIVLTEAGHVLLQYAETILRAEEEAQKEIAVIRGALRGRLRIGTNVTGGMYVLPPMIRQYRHEHPEVEISLAIETSPRIVDMVVQGILDVGLIGGPVDQSRFEVEAVGEDELVLIASSAHPLACPGEIPLAALSSEALILPGIGSRSRWILESRLREQGLPVRVALTMNGTEEVKKAVESNLGLAFVSSYSVRSEVREGRLVILRIPGFRIRRNFEVFWPKGQRRSELADRLLEIARSHLSQLEARHLSEGEVV